MKDFYLIQGQLLELHDLIKDRQTEIDIQYVFHLLFRRTRYFKIPSWDYLHLEHLHLHLHPLYSQFIYSFKRLSLVFNQQLRSSESLLQIHPLILSFMTNMNLILQRLILMSLLDHFLSLIKMVKHSKIHNLFIPKTLLVRSYNVKVSKMQVG